MKRALLVAAFVSCVAPGSAVGARLVLFPAPLTQLTPAPPFPPPDTVLPNVFRPPIRSNELIAVGTDGEGRVVSVDATQRLVLAKVGDYRLSVPAPAEDVEAGPGSESSPGLRRGAILWAGFSGGRKVLSAKASLEPGATALLLPLRLRVSEGSVRLENATTATASTFIANGDPVQLAEILDTLRTDPQGRKLGQSTYVKVTGRVRDARMRVTAPLEVTGRIGDREVSLVLGDGRPTVRTILARGRPSLELTVEPVPPASLLARRTRPSWTEALRASLTLARVRQYNALLANPDTLGPVDARYQYRSAAAPTPVPPAPTEQDAGLGAWMLALIIAGSLAAAGGLAVLWANS